MYIGGIHFFIQSLGTPCYNQAEFEEQLNALHDRVLSKALSDEEKSNYTESLFESIRHVNEYGQEFWYARDLQIALEYTEWRNFCKVIDKAKEACRGSNNAVSEHFVDVNKTSPMPNGGTRELIDIELSRYACYLIVQNSDPRKKVIALGQTYFAVKTRQQELIENYENLSEDQKRIAIRQEMKEHNKMLVATANLFRATQAEAKLRRENIQGKQEANKTHFEVGKKVRDTIKDLGGTMPEDLPTPEKSIQQLERAQKKKLKKNQPQCANTRADYRANR